LAVNAVVQLYFWYPQSPGQRGTCENPDGLLHQHLPKDTDLSIYTHDDFHVIAHRLDNRPRAKPNWHTAEHVCAQTLASSHRPSTDSKASYAWLIW